MEGFILDRSHYTFPNYRQAPSRTPYPFQVRAFEALDRLKSGNPKGYASMLVLPTGAGKTYTAAHWIIRNYLDCNVKVLWIAHRSELLRQAAEAFFCDTTVETLPNRESFTSFVASSEFGRCVNVPKSAPDLLIASRQSLCSGSNLEYVLKWAKGRGLKWNRRLLIVLDEAHHAAAASYRKIIASMKKAIPHVDVLGLTATPYRTAQNEQGSLRTIFSSGSGIVYSIDMNTLIRSGILSKPRHIEISTSVDMTELFGEEELQRISRFDLTSLDEQSLKKLDQNAVRNKLIVDTYLKDRAFYGQTIVFAVDIVNAIAINAIFQSAGVRSDYVVSGLVDGMNRSASTHRNPQVIRDFREGRLEVLINVNIVTEGTDIPNIRSVFLARPTTSKILMTQMIGRGLRGEAAGGTTETNLVYFIDDWKGLIDFVSPRELLDGANAVPKHGASRAKLLKHYIRLEEVAAFAVGAYRGGASIAANVRNIIPYGVIRCTYLSADDHGEESEVAKDLIVYDEAAELYRKVLADIPIEFGDPGRDYTMQEIRAAGSALFFHYCADGDGTFIGISSDTIQDLIRSYLSTQELPQIRPIEDRVSLMDIVKAHYTEHMTERQINEVIESVWQQNEKVRSWYDKEFYYGMMRVYFNRMEPKPSLAPEFVLPPKEQMDMGELKKHYPAYYHELREYLISRMKKDEEGYYYSDMQEEGKPPIRSKHLGMFEMDHIIPISRGGLTVKENLQMITRKQNLEKSDALPGQEK